MSEKKLLIIAFCYLVLDIFSFSLILPWLPTVFESFEERSCLSSTMAGALSDVYSRNPLLITLQTLSVIAHLLTAWLSTSFTCFFCFRLLCGATRANVAVLTALVSDHSQTGSRSRAMAVVGAAYSIGFTLGPLTSALTISSLADHFQSARLLQHIGYGSALLNVIGLLFLGASLPPVRTEINKSIISLSVACVVLGAASEPLLFYTGLLLFAFASAAFVPCFQAMVSLLAKPDRQVRLLMFEMNRVPGWP
ncbi:unnamed protein product [Echinostoma caproni]|uniref:MFS domain-containing protein n=1 Tax=Echinostoma caproni TaxID=27848 RepID=A0A183AQ12_9TREM|nr:unnamed protein product [Echinostoma caproni]